MFTAIYEDFVILLGARAVMSGVGMFLISFGNWQTDRQWDEQGSQLYAEQANVSTQDTLAAEYKDLDEEGQGKKTSIDNKDDITLAVQKEMAQRLGFGWTAMVGWLLLAVSMIFERNQWMQVENSPLGSVSMVLVLFIGFVQTVLLRKALLERNIHAQKDFFIVTLGLGFLLEGLLTALIDPDVPFWMAPLGVVCVATSPVILWWSRKMGRSFDMEGHPNTKPTVFNFGGPLMVFGWLWYWIGLNACVFQAKSWYLPIYLNSRALVACLAAVLVQIVLWVVGYALDEVDEEAAQDGTELAAGFGMAGQYLGSVWEIPIPMTLVWGLFGVACFLPQMYNWIPLFELLAFLALGLVYSYIQRTVLRSRDSAALTKWNYGAQGLLVVIVILISVSGIFLKTWHTVARTTLAVVGAFLFALGQAILHLNRKRGKYWMATAQQAGSDAGIYSKDVLPNPVVYSHGIPPITLGLLLLAWSITIL